MHKNLGGYVTLRHLKDCILEYICVMPLSFPLQWSLRFITGSEKPGRDKFNIFFKRQIS